MVRFAQLQQRHEADPQHCEHALQTLKVAEQAAMDLIQELKASLADHQDKGDQLKTQNLHEKNSDMDKNCNVLAGKDKGKAAERHASTPISDLPESEEDGLRRTPAGEEQSTKKGALQSRLRECHIILHQILFLQGDVYHVMGNPAEDAAYEEAEKLRQSLLKCLSNTTRQTIVPTDFNPSHI
jgi:E3 ubiquitin-protein ligase SHPRH